MRYLREYRENMRCIASEYQNQQASGSAAMAEMSGDHASVNQSYSNGGPNSHKYQAEITSLNQEIFLLRT